MKNVLSFLISLYYFSTLSYAGSTNDTTKLLAKNSVTSNVSFIIKESNVSYPSSLEEHRAQSLDYVQKFSEQKRDHLIRLYEKGKKYFPTVTTILEHYSLPEELKVLIALESAFNGNAISRAGAVGYWQLMDVAAREYGLHISGARDVSDIKSKRKDDRKNLSKSTQAAAKYLRTRSLDLDDDLLLIVASYNCGLGGVYKAMKKSGKENPDFWDVKKYLPAETRNYVMNFIALNVIFANYENFSNNALVFTPEYAIPGDIKISFPPLTVD